MEQQDHALKQAFVLRVSPGGDDLVDEALKYDEIIIGWGCAKGLLNKELRWEAFRSIVSTAYYKDETNLRKAGAAGGHLWRFIREMNIDDLVVIPHFTNFYIARILGEPKYYPINADDGEYRRKVEWLNGKKPIPRSLANAALLSRLKVQGTTAYASDLILQIEKCIEDAQRGYNPTFKEDLKSKLIVTTLEEIRSGRMESYKFEQLIHDVLLGFGADEARIVPRMEDKGADIVVSFKFAGAFQQILAVQAKHWQAEPPVGKEVVEQLIGGIEAESANLGMIVTSGTVSEEAVSFANKWTEEKGIKIEFVDGEQFAKLIVELGIKTI